MRKLALATGAAAAALGLAFVTPAAAWNARGHMMVAAIAWNKLDAPTKAAVARLLRVNPSYSEWTKGVPAADRDRIAFVRAATWPDDIKGAGSGYKRDDNHEKPPPGPQASQNLGYHDCLQHRYWHFKDIPFSSDGTALQPPPSVNAETQLKAFIRTLGDTSASDDVKSYDLVWLIHVAGDAHQPLHATSRFTHDATDGDGGGNRVGISGEKRASLHSYWDDILGTDRSPAAAIHAAAELAAAPNVGSLDPAVWLTQSEALAESKAYVPPVGPQTQPFSPDAAYHASVLQTARSQVALGGARLAAVLNAAHIRAGTSAHGYVCPAPKPKKGKGSPRKHR